jgi:hypothetical protein
MKKLLIALILPFMFGCATPDKPLSLDEKRQWQAEQYIVQARQAVFLAEAYVAIKKDEWPEDKVTKYTDLIDRVNIVIDGAEKLVAENDYASFESQKIIMDTLIQALESEQ